jgi:ABC-type phosphate/phosphonate transport system ATPase subunit
MIQLLGIGVPRRSGGWLLHHVTATFHRGELIVVSALDRDARAALLDVIAARRVPVEGRLWMDGMPLMADTVRRLRSVVADVDPGTGLPEARSVLWNVLAPPPLRVLGDLLRLPQHRQRAAGATALATVGLADRANQPTRGLGPADRARLLIARALVRRPRCVVVRELDSVLETREAMAILVLLRAITRVDRRIVVASLAKPEPARPLADRLLHLDDDRRPQDQPPAPPVDNERRLRLART